MARSIRIEYAGAHYHVMARGNRRERIFRDDEDRILFLKALAEACVRTGWRVHAWVLMSNHYHLHLETPEANLVVGMQWLQNTFTRRFNTRHRQWGRLFGDRYKAVLVEGAGYYYQTLLDYIHLNPVRAGLINARKGQSVLDFPWSSVSAGFALAAGSRPKWLAAADGLAAFGCADTARGRQRFVERLDRYGLEEGAERAGVPVLEAEVDARCSHLRRGWYWGSQAFVERLLALGEATLKKARHRGYRASGASRAHGEREACRLLQEGMAAANLTPRMLGGLKGSDPKKVAIARTIWHETTVSMSWIAEHLAMKSAGNASQQIHRGKGREREWPNALRNRVNPSKNVA